MNALFAAVAALGLIAPASAQLAASPAFREAAALTTQEGVPAPTATPKPAGLQEFSCRGDRMSFRNGQLGLRFIGAGGGVEVTIGGDFGPSQDFQRMFDAMGGYSNLITVAWPQTACSTDSTDSLLLRCEGSGSIQIYDAQGGLKTVMVEALLHFDQQDAETLARHAIMTISYGGHLYQENVDFPQGRCTGDAK